MVAIPESATYTASITRVETTDVALGGNLVNVPNKQFSEIANRFAWLKQQVDTLKGDATAQATTQEFTQVGVASIAQGRLTLVSGDPVGDASGATTVYYTPYNGDYIAIYNDASSRWDLRQFTERSLSLSGLAANTNYDIFAFWNGTTVELQPVPWSNSGYGSSARAVAIARLNGIWTKGIDNRRYVGTIRITGTAGQCEVSNANQFLWNATNRVSREMYVAESVDYSYGAAAWRYANSSSTSARVNMVIGLGNETVGNVVARIGLALNARGVSVAIGQNSIAPLNPVSAQYTQADTSGSVEISRNIAIPQGSNFFNALEFADFSSNLRNPAILLQAAF